MRSLLRLIHILWSFFKQGLDELLIQPDEPVSRFHSICHLLRLKKTYALSPDVRLRETLERLGPIFVKFGQVLSTRPDVIGKTLALELSKLQDKVPPFDQALSKKLIEQELKQPISEIFKVFIDEPVASASVAQVHKAQLLDGTWVAVKVLRPDIEPIIYRDIRLLKRSTKLLEFFSKEARRLRLQAIIQEFEKYLHDELNLLIEAANCSCIERNFDTPERAGLIIIPKVYWDFSTRKILTMTWLDGIPSSQIQALQEAGIDFKDLAKKGVEIFFTQVFEDGFFHADMHPGNIHIKTEGEQKGQYIALDFGIVGSLSDTDKSNLAQNFLAFFERDYRKIAQLHIDHGWAPSETRVEELERAVRTVCEPFFAKPLSELSLGQILMQLFHTSRRFNIEVQPQLVLLQKTLLNIEGMGRLLDPDLDLWKTAKPFLEKWVKRHIGPEALFEHIKEESTQWGVILPELPRLIHQSLKQTHSPVEKRQHNPLIYKLYLYRGLGIALIIYWLFKYFN